MATPQQAKRTIKLSPATIRAQQALSNKHGITTFNRQGTISTVSKSGFVSKTNVGQGSYKSAKTLSVAINTKIKENQVKEKIKSDTSKFKTNYSNGKAKPEQPSQKTPTVPKVLSKSTIDAQQKLADRYGIPTFDLKGGISTVPVHGVFSDVVNVGMGRFKTQDDFVNAIIAKYPAPAPAPAPPPPPAVNTSGGGGGFWAYIFGTPPVDTATGQTVQDTQTGLADQASQTILDDPRTPANEFVLGSGGGKSDGLPADPAKEESFIDKIINNPVYLGLGVIALVIISMSGGKKK